MSWSPRERTGVIVMLGSKYLMVKDGMGPECSEDREEQRQSALGAHTVCDFPVLVWNLKQ